MDIFKLQRGIATVYPIDVFTFEKNTGKKAPYYQINTNGKYSQFAICPACDNPIQIHSLYKKFENSPRPYGIHAGKAIEGIGHHNVEDYLSCIYANPNLLQNRNARVPNGNAKSLQNIELLKENFDRVVYILEKELEFRISPSLAEKMLVSFLDMEGHLYVGTNFTNLPWMFAYQTVAQNMFGVFVKETSALYNILLQQTKFCIKDGQIQKEKEFFKLDFYFINHRIVRNNETREFEESIDFIVANNNLEIFNKKIVVDQTYFYNIIHAEKTYRREEY